MKWSLFTDHSHCPSPEINLIPVARDAGNCNKRGTSAHSWGAVLFQALCVCELGKVS